MTYMANTRNVGETRESRGQVDKRLLEEARRVEARVQMNEDVDTVNIKQPSQWITHELQDFMIEKKLVRSKEWKEIILESEKQVEVEEELERQEAIRNKESERMLVRMRDSIREEVQGEMRRERATVPRSYTYRPIECFKCRNDGHIARKCSFGAEETPQERDRFDNKEFKYFEYVERMSDGIKKRTKRVKKRTH
ncbi:hypothetical protein NGRA_1863 [Nosema granulosis]|uniref:CCHC-type domain-containing protein n=1 Tax=Nosema granulosis TaxID=83296 RepID=A0A9P6GYP9_9MICR|nr:hypothetical protein NGRA_1863 [Nosema granulosis]